MMVRRFKITNSQLSAIKNAADTMSAMIGCGEPESDKEWTKIVKGIDRFLKANGEKRSFK